MEIKLYNTLVRMKQKFVPIDPNHVKIYVCGPTVYQRIHLGNIRSLVVFDLWVRLLKFVYPKVTYIRNITDIDDKIINQAQTLGISCDELVMQTIKQFHADTAALNLLSPDIEPRVTECIPDIIEFIQKILDKGCAYVVDGDVFFDVSKFPEYGNFACQNLMQIQAGNKADSANNKKKSLLDFALWKSNSDSHFPGWESPWSYGRPGWHIECSAMSYKYFGSQFDIHGGGIDLVFPHHQNEIAQSWACSSKNPANYWLHNGFLLFGNEKMSKSLGNIMNLSDFCKLYPQYPYSLIRLIILMTHYRQPLAFSSEHIYLAQNILHNWTKSLEKVNNNDIEKVELPEVFMHALADDLNTPKALSIMHQTQDLVLLKKMGFFLGIFGQDYLSRLQCLEFTSEELVLIKRRNQARRNKDFHTADIIRKELISCGIEVNDRDAQHSDYCKKSL